VGAMKIIKQLKLTTEFTEQFFWKDCSLNFLKKRLSPELVDEIKRLTHLGLEQPKQYITYDIGYQLFDEGTKSCRNTGWHVDGIGNEYLMFIDGEFRTEFTDEIDVHLFPEGRDKLREFNRSIAKTDVPGKSIPNSTLVSYTSSDIHRGRTADQKGSRFFIRVCNSDYLTPKNKRLM
jgi:hypothetical protein